jgi:predicted MarR family transcription regulator
MFATRGTYCSTRQRGPPSDDTHTPQRYTNIALNFALTGALFLSAELPLFADPPSSVGEAANAYVRWVYFGMMAVGIAAHTCCLITAVHSLNYLYRIRKDADWIDFCLA